MSDNIFTNYPTWTGTKATDTSNILDRLANAYNKQQQSFEGLATLHDDFWKTAQKQHQQDAVHFLNNMSADNLVKQDAKQNFLNALKQQGEDIGGYSNMPEWDTLYDSRVNTAIANENATRVFKEQQVRDVVTSLKNISNNVSGVHTPEEVNKATIELFNLPQKYENDPVKQQAFYTVLPDIHAKSIENKNNIYLLNEAKDKHEYESMAADKLNPFIDQWGLATAMVQIGAATDDTALKELGEKTLGLLKGHFNQKGAKDVDGKEIIQNGYLTDFVSSLPLNVQKYFHKNKEILLNKSTQEHFDNLIKANKVGIDMAKVKLAQDTLALEKQVTNEGSWYQQKDIGIKQESNNIKATQVLAGTGSGKGTNYSSFSGTKWIEENYAKLGISSPVIQDAEGNYVINKDNIITSINSNIQRIMNPDISALTQEYTQDPWFNGRHYTLNLGFITTKGQKLTDTLDKFTFTEGERKGEKLTDIEKVLLAHRYTKTKTAGAGNLISFVTEDSIKRNLRVINLEQENKISSMINDTIKTLTADFRDIKEGDVIFQLGLLWKYPKYLSKEQITAAEAARDAYTKVAFRLTPREAAVRGNTAPIPQGGLNKSSTTSSSNSSTSLTGSDSKKVPYRYANNPFAGWYNR